jgi:sigma-B regulation protein RsbU (phosphoserine phosphatase)
LRQKLTQAGIAFEPLAYLSPVLHLDIFALGKLTGVLYELHPFHPGEILPYIFTKIRSRFGQHEPLRKILDGDLALVIGDVSGKGVPAAMVMSNAQACLHSQSLHSGADISKSFETLNRVIMENTDDSTFVTFFFALLSPGRRSLTYINAGHDPPILIRKNGELHELGSSGLIVGILPDASYEPRQMTLSPGDLLLMYTDGVTEARSPDDEEFGTERLRSLL